MSGPLAGGSGRATTNGAEKLSGALKRETIRERSSSLRGVYICFLPQSSGNSTPVTPVVCSRKACGRGGGRFRLPPEKVANEIFSHCSRREIVASAQTSRQFLPHPSSRSLRSLRRIYAVIMTSQDFAPTVTLSDDQNTALIDLEPAFEHLLRDVGLDESTILALRHCRSRIVRHSLVSPTPQKNPAVLLPTWTSTSPLEGCHTSVSFRTYSWR